MTMPARVRKIAKPVVLTFALTIALTLLGLLIQPQPARAEVLLTPDEIRQTLRHGPWPPEHTADPSNRLSGNPAAIALGAALFNDPSLSVDQNLPCSACHQPHRDFTDRMPRAKGAEPLPRNTQALWNLAGLRWYGWAGDSDSLWAQNLTPLLNPAEMGHTPVTLKAHLHSSPQRPGYEALFGPLTDQPPQTTAVNIAKALAAYVETLRTGQTSFDRFRDALARGDFATAATYPAPAQRGLQIFLGQGNCVFCHSGPRFSNGEFHDAGVPYFLPDGGVDTGRYGGIKALQTSPYTLAGDHSDDAEKSGAWAVNTLRFSHANFGTFRTPSLRRVAKTAPYMHDGSLPDLVAVLDHYNSIDIDRLHAEGEAILRPLNLPPAALADIEAFLITLSDD